MFGILALQGGFALHQRALDRLEISNRLLKKPKELEEVGALIIPGGESTALLKLMEPLKWGEAISTFFHREKLIFGTCAGMILLSRRSGDAPSYLGLIDIQVRRNAYPREENRFVGRGTKALGLSSLEMVCIRAPEVVDVGKDVEVLAYLGNKPMLLRERNVVVAAFHPELSQSDVFYRWLVSLGGKS